MKVSLLCYRRVLLVCAALCVAVSLVMALGVIPPVQTDTFPGATPEKAVTAFWVIIGLTVLAAATFVLVAIWSKGRSWISTPVLMVLGVAVLLCGLVLTDAAFAYRSHGPSMQTAAMLLFFGVAADFLVGALAMTTAFLRPKKT